MLAKYTLQQPTLCMVVGVPASGKSKLAEGLAKELVNAAYISKDLIQAPFTRTERVVGNAYSMVRGPAFEILVKFADKQLSLGKTPIIDAPFSINHWRNDEYSNWVRPFKETASKHNARLAIIRRVPPDEEELKKRIRKRVENSSHIWDKWKLDNWDIFKEQEPVNFPIEHDDVYNEVPENRPVSELVKEILHDYLKAKVSPQPF